MMRSIGRRLNRVEQAVPIPMTRDRLVALVHRDLKRTGESVDSVIGALIKDLGDRELDSLHAECEHAMFGSNVAARDAWRREVLGTDAVQLGFSQ
jgi:hypothetical protein